MISILKSWSAAAGWYRMTENVSIFRNFKDAQTVVTIVVVLCVAVSGFKNKFAVSDCATI